MPRDQLLARVAGKDGLFCFLTDRINAEVLDAAGLVDQEALVWALQTGQIWAAGLDVMTPEPLPTDHILTTLPNCSPTLAVVGVTPDVLTKSCAELTVTLLLATARRLFECSAQITSEGWAESQGSQQWMLSRSVAGSTVGIFGLGSIGLEVLRKLSVFDVGKFLYNSNGPKELGEISLDKSFVSFERLLQESDFVICTAALNEQTRAKFNKDAFAAMKNSATVYVCSMIVGGSYPVAEFVSFERLLQESDFVICTAALNEQTRAKFNKDAFAAMKNSAVFINTSRGGLVDQEALVWAIQTGQIRAAGLDVMTPEPLPADHILTTLPNCTLLPHLGTSEERTRAAMAELAADNLLGGLIVGKQMPKRLC
ncbi:hypothetical protein HAZT_HAZT005629 [Hyalella azteca]|uniref:D-isomer specific 2-hydroxyacid dehydrogenase NAD-binding domain-containing protein n=1 Tax=Hyalella azteca TaxID=294128 RepID=A0A6A0H3J6_HYAAZ|nr:hypothetical protein HAZT_HAZT005629 [Hyalella azteca]